MFSLLCQTRYYYVNHSIQEHVFQNVETQFFFTKIYSKIEFFHCQSVNSQLQQVTANDPQSVFFYGRTSWFLNFNHVTISWFQLCQVIFAMSLTKLDCERGKIKRGRALRLKSNRNLALNKRILRNSTRKGNWKNVTKMDKGLW